MIRSIAILSIRAVNRMLLIPALYVIECIWRVRLTPVYTDRLAHLATNTYLFASRRNLFGREPRTLRILFGANPCNKTLFSIWKDFLGIVESRLLTFWYQSDIQFLRQFPFFETLENPGFIYSRETDNAGCVLKFSDAQREQGTACLRAWAFAGKTGLYVFKLGILLTTKTCLGVRKTGTTETVM